MTHNNDRLQQKVIDLETSLGLLQRDFEKQNEMLLANTRLLQQLEMSVKRLTDIVAGLQADSGGEQLMKQEKPPHY